MALPDRTHRILALLLQYPLGVFPGDLSRLHRLSQREANAGLTVLADKRLAHAEHAETPYTRPSHYTITAAGRAYLETHPEPHRPRKAWPALILTLITAAAAFATPGNGITPADATALLWATTPWLLIWVEMRRFPQERLTVLSCLYLGASALLFTWAALSHHSQALLIGVATIAAAFAILRFGGLTSAHPEPGSWRPRYWYIPQTGRAPLGHWDITAQGVSVDPADVPGVLTPAECRDLARKLLLAADVSEQRSRTRAAA